MSTSPSASFDGGARRFAWVIACLLAVLLCPLNVAGQQLIYSEGFNDDGEAAAPQRYTTVGRGAGMDGDGNLGFWGHSFDDGVDITANSVTGAFPAPVEGSGSFVGADLNNPDFGGGANPRTLTLAPVDLSAWTNVEITVALANGNTADMWETSDFLRILLDKDNDGTFETTLANFLGGGDAGDTLIDQLGAGTVPGDAWADFAFGVPDDATLAALRFESLSSFPDEIVGIDNIRFTGVPEPATISLLILGALGVGRRVVRRRAVA